MAVGLLCDRRNLIPEQVGEWSLVDCSQTSTPELEAMHCFLPGSQCCLEDNCLIIFFLFPVLEIEHRSLHMTDKCSITELHPWLTLEYLRSHTTWSGEAYR